MHVCQGWHGLEMMDSVALPPSPLLDIIPPEVLNDHDGIRSCMECSACLFLVLMSDLWPLRRMCRAFSVSPTYCFLIFACSLRNPDLLSSPKSLMLVPQCHLTFQSEMACTCMYMYTLHCVVLMESVTPFPVYFSDFSITLWPHADLHAFYTAGSRFTLRYQPTSVPNQQVLLQNKHSH